MTATPAITSADTETTIARHGVFRQLMRRPLAVISMAVLVVLTIVAIVQPWITPFSPIYVDLTKTNATPFSTDFILGGDRYGRDMLSVLISGTRNSMLAGFIMASIALVLGIGLGLIAGYAPERVDVVLSALNSVLLAIPGIILLIAMYTLVEVSMPVAMATLGILSSSGIFILVRALTRNVRNELYVDAARVSGLPVARIIGRHVLLAIRGPIVIQAAFLYGGALALSAGLDFLGLGDPSQPSWGSVLNDAFINYYIAPWQLIWPGLLLGIAMAAFVLLGNALRDVLEGTHVRLSAKQRRRQAQRLRPTEEAESTEQSTIEDDHSTGPNLHPALHVSGSVSDPLLSIRNLSIGYPSGKSLSKVVDGVDLDIYQGEIVGLVGESGSGKTQTVFSALGLLPEQAIVTHRTMQFAGKELGGSKNSYDGIRGVDIAYVPQEPMSNLDPSFRIGDQLVEGIRVQTDTGRAEAKDLALSMLNRVGIRDPHRTFRSYPHELSGGMAQRVLIAGAVATRPRLLIADEPTTALDVTVQAEVLDMLRDLQADIGMAVLLVTHNLGVVADLCERVVVMRTGAIVEAGSSREVLLNPRHEYTKMLVNALLDNAELRQPINVGAAVNVNAEEETNA